MDVFPDEAKKLLIKASNLVYLQIFCCDEIFSGCSFPKLLAIVIEADEDEELSFEPLVQAAPSLRSIEIDYEKDPHIVFLTEDYTDITPLSELKQLTRFCACLVTGEVKLLAKCKYLRTAEYFDLSGEEVELYLQKYGKMLETLSLEYIGEDSASIIAKLPRLQFIDARMDKSVQKTMNKINPYLSVRVTK